ncbi:hypothetical protein BOFE_00920 [Candidatus Borrelia fainii]|uniref:Uncharacterized protein n=1 Tax=Candidatus Borrelia fainii TaxID=2518322 RepID=A0ABN6UQD8_9SPIR|nr:hypothetical protein BOFE_00920 [Candidatus Borrelia fainii]
MIPMIRIDQYKKKHHITFTVTFLNFIEFKKILGVNLYQIVFFKKSRFDCIKRESYIEIG